MKIGKRETAEGIELPNQVSSRPLGKKRKLFGNFGSSHHQREMKEEEKDTSEKQ